MAKKTIKVINVDTETKVKLTFEEVSVCPRCNCAIMPKHIKGYYVPENTTYMVELCPKCKDLFFVKYCTPKYRYVEDGLESQFTLDTYPLNSPKAEFSKEIKELSPMFVKIYNQAVQAEELKLSEICGCGYRKSLEFLVKDYLICKHNLKEADIKSEPLGKSLERIDDSRIKTLSQRAAWIGNDETHYVKKHEDLDIAEMKKFINAALHYIESDLAFEEAFSIKSQK